MAKKKKKWYVVWAGREQGIFETWDECKAQTDGYKNAIYKSYDDEETAKRAFFDEPPYDPTDFTPKANKVVEVKKTKADYKKYLTDQELRAICVDAACSGAVGPMEYRGVWLEGLEPAFASKLHTKGTNNIGEFLAIVEAMMILEERGERRVIFSDSKTAISWVRDKKVNSTLVEDEETKEVWAMVRASIQYLKQITYKPDIRKWESAEWGEIPADYGRK